MSIRNVKRWQWIGLSLIIGLGFGYIQHLPTADWRSAFGNTISQQEFEEGLVREQSGLKWFRNVVVYPEFIDDGGKRVRLKEPNGYQIEVVYGIKKLKPIPVKRQALNLGSDALKRAGTVMRIHQGPARVKRIGHGVMASPKVVESARWFRETLGFICSDDVYAGSKDNIIGSFNRLDRGSTYVDHHVYFCVRNERAGLNHLSFEVADIDDVFTGHEHLRKLGKYEHMWGIGRHLLGSQIYDYWADPWGRVHEHWADTDRLNTKNGSNLISAEEGLVSQWGERPPERFLNRVIS